MKMHFSILLMMLAFSACRLHEPSGKLKISKLSFATGGCFGECPFMAMEIDSALSMKYYGGPFAEFQGYYEGKIPQALWDTINMKFAPLQYKDLDSKVRTVDDLAIECLIHFAKSVKRINRQESELPEAIRNNFYWLIGIPKKASLEKVGDTLAFETVIQYAHQGMKQ